MTGRRPDSNYLEVRITILRGMQASAREDHHVLDRLIFGTLQLLLPEPSLDVKMAHRCVEKEKKL